MTMINSTFGSTMEIDAFLADAAESVQGKIYALGIGWNTIYAPMFPAVHPRVAIGITIHVPYTATNQMHSIVLHLEKQDGGKHPLGHHPPSEESGIPTPIYELMGNFNVGRPPMLTHGDEQIVALAMVIDQIQFETPEMFSWVLSIDGEPLKKLPMRVQHLAQPPMGR